MNQLPESSTYETETFFQDLRRRTKPVFGQGWTVTMEDLRQAFWAVHPELRDDQTADVYFDIVCAAALVMVVNAAGFKVIDYEPQQSHD